MPRCPHSSQYSDIFGKRPAYSGGTGFSPLMSRNAANQCPLKAAFPERIPFPATPNPTGVIIPEQTGVPRIGVWMMPDNQSAGELEDFVRQMMPVAAPVWPEAQRYIDNIPPGLRKFDSDKTDKAKLYAWLATLKEPARMGAAIGDGDLETTGPLGQAFTSWLADRFG